MSNAFYYLTGKPATVEGAFLPVDGGNGFYGSFSQATVLTPIVSSASKLYRVSAHAAPLASGYSSDSLNATFSFVEKNLSGGAPITNVSITSNVLTVTVANGFSSAPAPSPRLFLSGLTTATFLNGKFFVPLTFSGSQFTAGINHADYASAPDTGTTQIFRTVNLVSSLTIDGGINMSASGSVLGNIVAFSPPSDSGALALIDLTVVYGGSSGVTTRVQSTSLTSNVATFTVASVSGFSPGDSVLITGCADNTYNSTVASTIASVVGSTITVNITHANIVTMAEYNAFLTSSGIKSITATQLTSNVATFTCSNDFVPGQRVLITGVVTNPSVYNSSTGAFIILTASVSDFTVAITHADIGLQAETATASVQARYNFDARVEALP